MDGTAKASASCECGAVTIHIDGPPVVQLVCHCRDCRDFSGMACVEAAFFMNADCSVTGELESVTIAGGTGFEKTHYSCANCKAPLYVSVGALNGAWAVMAERISPFTFEAMAHIWTSEAVENVAIPAGLPHSPQAPPKEIVDAMVSSFWGK